jgi:hypothetical protein
MFIFVIIGFLAVSLAIVKYSPKIAGIFDFSAALVIFFSKVVPGKDDAIDWVFMLLLFMVGTLFCLSGDSPAVETVQK